MNPWFFVNSFLIRQTQRGLSTEETDDEEALSDNFGHIEKERDCSE
jgi:hypothetical protein